MSRAVSDRQVSVASLSWHEQCLLPKALMPPAIVSRLGHHIRVTPPLAAKPTPSHRDVPMTHARRGENWRARPRHFPALYWRRVLRWPQRAKRRPEVQHEVAAREANGRERRYANRNSRKRRGIGLAAFRFPRRCRWYGKSYSEILAARNPARGV